MRNRFTLGILIMIIAATILAGCKSEPEENSPAEITGTIEVSFDGQTCAVQGPESVPAGKVIVQFNNNSEQVIMVGFYRLINEKTWDDLLALIGVPGSEVSVPTWVKGPVNTEILPDAYWEDDFPVNAGNTYAVVCLDMATRRAWPGAPLAIEP